MTQEAVHSVLDGGTFVLRRARIASVLLDEAIGEPDEDGFVDADLLISDGRIAAIGDVPDGDLPAFDMDSGQVWPGTVDMHTHLDKGHIVRRARNRLGTVTGAGEAVRADRTANWAAADIERRFDFSLRSAYAHGTVAVRTHIDSYHPQAPISWPVFARMRDAWKDRITLQGVALTTMDVYDSPAGAELADLVARSGGILGGVTLLAGGPQAQDPARLARGLDALFRLAAERGLDVDLHVDETAETEPDTLRAVAEAVLRTGFSGKVVCGHCCSLALREEADAARTIALVRDAGIVIVSLPMVNLHLQGRVPGGTPRWRGVTLLSELAAHGVPVAVASDNCRDPFFAYGDLDLVEVFREAVRICHLDDHPADWLRLVTRWPADTMRLGERGRIACGLPADLILFRARHMDELFARPQADRIVLRNGRRLAERLPDYRELDDLFTPRRAV